MPARVRRRDFLQLLGATAAGLPGERAVCERHGVLLSDDQLLTRLLAVAEPVEEAAEFDAQRSRCLGVLLTGSGVALERPDAQIVAGVDRAPADGRLRCGRKLLCR